MYTLDLHLDCPVRGRLRDEGYIERQPHDKPFHKESGHMAKRGLTMKDYASDSTKVEILIVEDSRTQAEELKYTLERHDVTVSVAGPRIVTTRPTSE